MDDDLGEFDNIDDFDDFDDENNENGADLDDIDDGDNENNAESEYSRETKIMNARDQGFMDGEFDSRFRGARYLGYGASVNGCDMSDEERIAYEDGYENGYDMGGM